jgi:hypothetical protein
MAPKIDIDDQWCEPTPFTAGTLMARLLVASRPGRPCGAILVLERTDGARMPGLVTLSDGGFNFKLYGGPPDDPGLDFTK